MKAKQLAQTYLDAPYLQRDETLTSICTTFVNDLHEMLRIRQPTNDAGAIAILRELDTKWRAMSRLTDGAIVGNGFVLLVDAIFPPLSGKWEKRP